MKNQLVYLLLIITLLSSGCRPAAKQGENRSETGQTRKYGDDLEFLRKYADPVELVNGGSKLAVVPRYQGRVMTSTSAGLSGFSHGWINYELIASGEIREYANPYGGEERLWLGPEGGQFSLFFLPEQPQWTIPPALDHEAFDVVRSDSTSVTLVKDLELKNFSGTNFKARITRIITLLGTDEIRSDLGIKGGHFSIVAYQSENRLQNTGDTCWNKKEGALSIWMLSMLKASPSVTVVIPLRKDNRVVHDYFGGIPGSRLKTTDHAVFFKADGEFRSKIGLLPGQVLPYIASYDTANKILTILKYALTNPDADYVNSSLENEQADPFSGDVVNAYNDGPSKDGPGIGPLYELETSSPAAFLEPGEEIVHTQRIFHLHGQAEGLEALAVQLLQVSPAELGRP